MILRHRIKSTHKLSEGGKRNGGKIDYIETMLDSSRFNKSCSTKEQWKK
jgi:alpha-D-ribose 1-methylphosphonate 5-triphosphate synthase subunit PhnI